MTTHPPSESVATDLRPSQTQTDSGLSSHQVRWKRVAVTGANGFIGANMLERLELQGVQVRAIVRQGRRPLAPHGNNFDHVEFLDIGLDSESDLRDAFRNVDVVIHLAGKTAGKRYRDYLDVNRLGTQRVLRAARSAISPPKVIIVSSLAAAGPSTRSSRRVESQIPSPISWYGRSKLATEKIAQRFASDLPISIIRPGIVFGPLDRSVLALVRMIAVARINLLAGYHSPRISFVHVDDLNDAILRAAQFGTTLLPQEHSAEGAGIYFVADPATATFSEFGKWIAKGLGYSWHLNLHVPIWLIGTLAWWNQHATNWSGVPETLNVDKIREAASEGWECDVTSAMMDLGWKPRASLEHRIRETIDWYRQNKWLR